MNCPDMEHLIDFGQGESDDLEIAAHVQSCQDCQADLRTIKILAGVGGAEREISEEMISRIISGLPKAEVRKGLDWAKGIQLCLTGGLGFLTALVTIVVTGTMGTVRPREALLLAVGFGAICVFSSFHQEQNLTPSKGDHIEPEPA